MGDKKTMTRRNNHMQSWSIRLLEFVVDVNKSLRLRKINVIAEPYICEYHSPIACVRTYRTLLKPDESLCLFESTFCHRLERLILSKLRAKSPINTPLPLPWISQRIDLLNIWIVVDNFQGRIHSVRHLLEPPLSLGLSPGKITNINTSFNSAPESLSGRPDIYSKSKPDQQFWNLRECVSTSGKSMHAVTGKIA